MYNLSEEEKEVGINSIKKYIKNYSNKVDETSEESLTTSSALRAAAAASNGLDVLKERVEILEIILKLKYID